MMMKGEGKVAIVSVHNNPFEILPGLPLHMMLHFVAIFVVAFTIDVVVAAAFAGVLHMA